jgi:hypothetical protein
VLRHIALRVFDSTGTAADPRERGTRYGWPASPPGSIPGYRRARPGRARGRGARATNRCGSRRATAQAGELKRLADAAIEVTGYDLDGDRILKAADDARLMPSASCTLASRLGNLPLYRPCNSQRLHRARGIRVLGGSPGDSKLLAAHAWRFARHRVRFEPRFGGAFHFTLIASSSTEKQQPHFRVSGRCRDTSHTSSADNRSVCPCPIRGKGRHLRPIPCTLDSECE